MGKDLQKNKEVKKDGSMGMIMFSSLGIVLLFIVELYLMITMPELLPGIAVVGIAIVGCAYLDLSTIIKKMHLKELEQEEQYNSLLKSEKASYLLIRKYFDEIEEQLTLMEDIVTEPFQEVVAAQKATAKVTINRNKENAVALMNSNDKLLNIIFEMEEKIDQMAVDVSGMTNNFSEYEKNLNTDYIQKQTEMSNQICEMELNVKNEILQAVNKLSSVSPQVVMTSSPMPMMQQPMAAAPVMNTPVNNNIENTFDNGSLEGLGDLPDFTLEPELELAEEPELEPKPEPEPIVEDVPPMPDMSDPNKVMSPDDIAALLANMNATQPVEPEPEPEPEPIVEEKPPMPDMSDPNRSMSPDEIAALFANLG